LDGAAGPVTAPVAIGGTAWGPWQRICREQTLRPGRPPQRDCLTVAEARPEAGGMRLLLQQEATGLRISALRTAEGRIAEFAAVRTDGSAEPPDPARDGLVASWRDQFATLSLERRRIPAREIFEMPMRGSARGMRCRAESTAAIRGRAVVVLICGVELAGTMGSDAAPMEVQISVRMAVDTNTGMLVAQSYATRIERFAVAADGRRRSIGVVVTPTRVTLE
ncbi:hypothetical protein, partial [Neoroseomonas soli]